ncbi:hypothetical protein PEL8287_01700 [Roseovarius litorisediminis]|uniref:Type IV pilus biogenesis n=1 Tax=Roseovarius litorisediminis TaxID=1312363 RepID=A0A1Y5S8S8_9RHOB|nr:hypothetical protein [Roseovarius litorisediminis]SLN34388.1 hypothetical protein PEL8287_01700 [Roseovarius litorisediminis]
MKPNFALSLSFEGIGVLHRAIPGWHLVGEVALDSADLTAELAELRNKANALDPTGLSSKLIIPNDQIRYLELDSDEINDDNIKGSVREALEGATPYAVEELAYDWSRDNGKVYVAAVAQETLSEAENFAQEHKFNPVSFVALPDPDSFCGEPFFGITAYAKRTLANGEKVKRDETAMHIISASPSPKPENKIDTETRVQPAFQAGSSLTATPTDARNSAPEKDPEPQEAEAVSFSSIRAVRHDVPGSAPKLTGAARFIPAADQDKINDQTETEETSPTFASQRSPKPAVGAPQTIAKHKEDPSGLRDKPAFGTQPAPQIGGKPRYLGLILTAALLLILMAVAVWASIFLEGGVAGLFRSQDEPRITELSTQQDATKAEVPEISAPDDIQPNIDPEQMVVASLSPDEPPEIPAQETLTQPTPAELTPDQALARYAATGIWQMAPFPPNAPSPTDLDDFYQTSIDPLIQWQDAVALPVAQTALIDIRPPTPNSPVHADTLFDLDDQGRVIATPNGALTPEGIFVFAGQPPAVPPDVPERLPVIPTETTEPSNLRLASVRPQARPDDLSETNERGTLGGRSKSELAALRPRLRPKSAQQVAEEAASSDPKAINAAVSLAVKSTTPFSTATPQAVTESLKPLTRPRNFDNVVKRNQPSNDPTITASAAQKVSPRIPSTASVAKQATQRDAINLRRVNLIGVYGTPSRRRALVMLSNGRYQKVQVGDRLDGGRVAAIGDSELRYIKGGRNVVLKMPRG